LGCAGLSGFGWHAAGTSRVRAAAAEKHLFIAWFFYVGVSVKDGDFSGYCQILRENSSPKLIFSEHSGWKKCFMVNHINFLNHEER
jgi:hypothetical protein